MVVSASTLSRHVFVSLLIAIAAMVATPARAMGPDPHIVTIDDVGGEQIDLLVTDGDDRLDSDDVNVMIDGTRVPATVTPLPRREVDIVVATGVAGDALRRALQGALVEFAMQVLPASDMAIDSADTAAFTSNPELLVQRIRDLATDASPTAVVSDAIDAPVVPATDRAVVVVGDQQELRDALGGRQRQINDRDDVVGSRSVPPMLQRLASDSGGQALALDQAAQLTGALDRTADDLFNRYRVQAPLPTGIAGSDLSVQIATPTGVSEIMPASFVQPATDGQAAAATGDQVAAAADPQAAAAPPVVVATPVTTPFVTGNLLAVIGLSTIPLSGVLIVGFMTVEARRRPKRAHASAAVVSDEVGEEVLATQQALEGLRWMVDADDRHAPIVRMTEAVASVALDDPGIGLERFLVEQATGAETGAGGAIRRLITALDDDKVDDLRDGDVPRVAARVLGYDPAVAGSATAAWTHAPDAPPLLRIASEHAAIATIDDTGQVARLTTVLRVFRTGELASPTFALSWTLGDDLDGYRAALDHASDDAVAWTMYLLQAIGREATRTQHALANIAAVHDAWESRLDTTSRGRFPAFVEDLFTQPLVTARHVAETMDISHQGALNLIRQAEKRGWLSDYGRFGRGGRRHWIASSIVSALDGSGPALDDSDPADGE